MQLKQIHKFQIHPLSKTLLETEERGGVANYINSIAHLFSENLQVIFRKATATE